MTKKSDVKISVVLGTYNQREKLERAMNSYHNINLPPEEYELIIVDSSSTDGTDDLLKNFKCDFHYQYIIQENNGKAGARNSGVMAAKAALIMITDADMITHPDILKTHIEAHANTTTPTVFEGLTYNMETYDWPADPKTVSPYITRDYKDGAKLGWWYFLTGNLSFSKELFIKLGKFDEEFAGYGWEDLECGYRFSKAGIPLYYLRNAINFHYHVISKEAEIDRNFHKGVSAKIFLRKHPELKWFLGLNPISVALFKGMSKDGFIIRRCKKWLKSPEHSVRKRFAIWFLSEHTYLSGLLSEDNG